MIDPLEWKPTDGLTFEPNALLAIKEVTRSIAITAGPGAGKTELLAQRADFLLRTGLCPYPRRILAISFKVDASHNLKDRVRQRCSSTLAERLDSYTFHGLSKRIVDRFRSALAPENKLDPDYTIEQRRYGTSAITFSELIPFALEILERSLAVRNAVRQTYSHVFLDEFQDCTSSQFGLVRRAFFGTDTILTAVGDPKQRIMSWAGALEGVFADFASDFTAKSLNLYHNFRSLPRLRRIQNAMVKIMEPAAAVADEHLSLDGGEVSILHPEDSRAEAVALAALIKKWVDDERVPPSEIAVLVAKQPELYLIELMAELNQTGVPFRNEKDLQDIGVEPICRLIVDFLLVVVGEREPEAYVRLMEVLGDVSAADGDHERERWSALIDDERASFKAAGVPGNSMPLLKSLGERFLEELGQEAAASLSPEYGRGNRLATLVQQTFVSIEALLSVYPLATQALARFADDDSVRIMTVHKSKGLEFECVVFAGIEKEFFWNAIDKERPVFFVGISRAKKRLVLTAVSRRPRPASYSGRWDVSRTPHDEFLGYAGVEVTPS